MDYLGYDLPVTLEDVTRRLHYLDHPTTMHNAWARGGAQCSVGESSSMKPRWRAARIALAVCLPLAGCGNSRSAEGGSEERLNIVLFLADDLGFNDLSIQGSEAIPTPHIDALADEGALLTNAYVTAASCGPSRAALLSGRYQQRFGFEFNTGPRAITHALERGLDPSVVLMTDLFDEAGYVTGIVGKWHLGSQERFHPLERAFDEFFGFLGGGHPYFPETVADREVWETVMRDKKRAEETDYLTDALAREAVSFIERHRNEPFFLYLPFNAVHAPIAAPDEYLERFADVEDETQRTYYAMVSALDDAVGDILQALEDLGLADDTLVVFTNDNGGMLEHSDNQPLRLGKLFLFEGGVRVPMIVRWPGVTTAGQLHVDTVSMLDLFPTFLGAAGIDPPDGLELDGVDLRPYLGGGAFGPTQEFLFWRNGPNLAVLHGSWKLIRAGNHVWLFDLKTDTGERANVAEDNPEVVADLLKAFDEWASEMRPPAWPSRRDDDTLVDKVLYEIHI